MAIYTITNSAKGARGVGTFLVDAGQTVDAELTEDDALLLSGFDDVKVDPAKPAKPAKVAEPE